MQQAYQKLKVISEAQTVQIVLPTSPGELALRELCKASEGLHAGSDTGLKAVVLDFGRQVSGSVEHGPLESELLARACEAVSAIPQPALAVVRSDLSEAAGELAGKADFILMAREASLRISHLKGKPVANQEESRLGGLAAERLGLVTWTAGMEKLDQELERILALLRGKSALALRQAKVSARLARDVTEPLEALRRVNQFYLEHVLPTEDAREGLRAFLEKRQPRWKNH